MEIRKAVTPEDIIRAIAIDETLLGSTERGDYIRSVAGKGGLSVAILQGEIQAFCCLDHNYFFGQPFVSLLVVSAQARRLGLGTALLSHDMNAYSELWTSTNRSNTAMRALLDKAGWQYCGEVSGLDDGDPERFYRTP